MALENTDIEYLKEIFVTKEACETKHDKVEEQINDNKTIAAVINTKLNWLIAILAAIGTCLLPIIIKMMIGG